MNPLRKIIETEIRENGPIGLDRYMELCLSHPEYGYYMSHQPFGKSGDFTTSPEISQMFGELIGLWLVHMWQELGEPNPFALVELGPGRGTLMADILRVARLHPAFLSAAQIFLLESSRKLQTEQTSRLQDFEVTFLDTVSDIPEMPIILVANEFFDALPVRQFVKNDFGWQERMLNEKFEICLAKTIEMAELDKRFEGVETGRIVEVNLAGETISDVITKKITAQSGAALIVDYGEFDGVGDTMQAVKNHHLVNLFDDPGAADVSAHVRFTDLVQNGVSHAFTTQRDFLSQLGIDTRRQVLESKSGFDLGGAQEKLIGEDNMGLLFKVLAISSLPLTDAPGFQK